MKTIDRFVLKSYVGPMVLTFFIVIFILFMNIIWRYIEELVGKGLPFTTILEYLFYASGKMIVMGLPLSTLLAAIMTMGNLGENYELLAMKSSGMSLQRIMRPLMVLVFFVSLGSFFVANNFVPYANKKANEMRNNIKSLNPTLKFTDGVFYNGIPDMSIRVGSQDNKTGLLRDILIYDNSSNRKGNMQTTLADSGYIYLSEDKSFLMVKLFHGSNYITTRDMRWYDESELEHQIFREQYAALPMTGFSMEEEDLSFKESAAMKNIAELTVDIDSLKRDVSVNIVNSYEPLLKEVLSKDRNMLGMLDSVKVDYSFKRQIPLYEDISDLGLNDKIALYSDAKLKARNSSELLSNDEGRAKMSLNQLYMSQIEWHRKISLPFSIMIFFLIGAPLGAIIRKGGLGMPIVVSVLFFVFYYIIYMTGERMAKEGAISVFVGMWLSSFVLLPIAVYLTYKATNDSNLFNMDWYRVQIDRLKTYIRNRKKAGKDNGGNNGQQLSERNP